MKENFKKIFALGLFVPMFFACSTEEVMENLSSLNSQGEAWEMQPVAAGDLTGTWVMHSMTSDIAVDLNFDENRSNDVLAETDCFDGSYFTFDEKGGFRTGQAKLDFGADSNKFECAYGEYDALFEVDGNELAIKIQINDTVVSQSKTIALSSNDSGDYLHLSLEDYEVSEFINDPGTTVASGVERIEIVYKKR